MKKKIGIITFYRALNYGAILQAYALCKYLNEQFDCDAELIDYRFKNVENERKLINYNVLFNNNINLFLKIKIISSKILKARRFKKIIKNFDSFINEYMPVSKKCNNISDLKQLSYDYYIVGSDLVWNPDMIADNMDVLFLEFTSSKKLSYAASIGMESIPKDTANEYTRRLKDFSKISVREESAEQILGDKLNITTVADPTLLLNKKYWNELFTENTYSYEYIFAMMLEYSDHLIDTVAKIKKQRPDLKIISLGNKSYFGEDSICMSDISPAEFLSIISRASYVVSNSYHGCIFSIVFEKEFFCIPHTKRGARMIELLEKLDLSKRIIHPGDDVTFDQIDYSNINKNIEEFRKKSEIWLNEALI